MATAKAKVTFRKEYVKGKTTEAKSRILEELALQIEAQAKINIVDNDQVDTGFMLNSAYTVTDESSGYSQARSESKNKNPKAEMSPEASAGDADAVIVIGAEYAIHQEERRSFLFKAGEQVAKRSGATIERVGQETLSD